MSFECYLVYQFLACMLITHTFFQSSQNFDSSGSSVQSQIKKMQPNKHKSAGTEKLKKKTNQILFILKNFSHKKCEMHTMLKKSLENRPFSKNNFYEHPVLDSYTYVLAQCHETVAWQSEVAAVVPRQELEVAYPLARRAA